MERFLYTCAWDPDSKIWKPDPDPEKFENRIRPTCTSLLSLSFFPLLSFSTFLFFLRSTHLYTYLNDLRRTNFILKWMTPPLTLPVSLFWVSVPRFSSNFEVWSLKIRFQVELAWKFATKFDHSESKLFNNNNNDNNSNIIRKDNVYDDVYWTL